MSANVSESVGSGGMDDSEPAWFKAGRQHEDTFLRLNAQVRNWRRIAGAAMAVTAIAVCGQIYVGSKSKYIPMLVEVDKLGHTLAVRALTGDDAVTDAQRSAYREMFDLIENLRTVSTDRAANDERLKRGYSRLTGAAREYAHAEIKKAPPNDVGATKTVQIIVKTALKLKGKSWQIEWEEHPFTLTGAALPVESWRATLLYELIPSGEEKQIRTNPVGFTVSELSWMKVN